MGKLIYSALMSLDGFTEDTSGDFQWAAPDEEVLALVNDLERDFGTTLYGRRMYETLVYWETADTIPELTPASREFMGIWKAAEKVVYSTTLESVSSARTRIERRFDPDEVRRMKADLATDISIGGADLAAQAIRARLVDEYQLFCNPVLIGTGKPALPKDVRIDLELVDHRIFESGVVYLHYRLPNGLDPVDP